MPLAETSQIGQLGHHESIEARPHSVIRANYTSSSRTLPNLIQDTDKLRNTHIIENTFHPHRIEIGERTLIQEPWVLHATLREVINHHVEESIWLSSQQMQVFTRALSDLLDVASRACEAETDFAAADIWQEAFEHLFPMPEGQQALVEMARRLPVKSVMPDSTLISTILLKAEYCHCPEKLAQIGLYSIWSERSHDASPLSGSPKLVVTSKWVVTLRTATL
ncbi:hypothetical protein [Brucella anthropi]